MFFTSVLSKCSWLTLIAGRNFKNQNGKTSIIPRSKRRVNFQSNEANSSQQRRSGGTNIPTWTREPSHVPAPVMDAGIGYGYGVPQQQVRQGGRSNAPQFQYQ